MGLLDYLSGSQEAQPQQPPSATEGFARQQPEQQTWYPYSGAFDFANSQLPYMRLYDYLNTQFPNLGEQASSLLPWNRQGVVYRGTPASEIIRNNSFKPYQMK